MKDKLTVFYADDDSEDREIFREIISSIGGHISLLTHDKGDQLLNALRSQPPLPQIIFLDINMPGKNGFEILDEVRRCPEFINIPVVAFTTSSDLYTISKCMMLGANFYITKSSSFESLKKSVEFTLNIDWKNFKPKLSEFIYKP